MEVSDNPNMRVDPYTGTLYDANLWYRGANAIWINKNDEKRQREASWERYKARKDRQNANRVARGKRKRTMRSFVNAKNRYGDYLREHTEETFHEWLRRMESDRKWLGKSY